MRIRAFSAPAQLAMFVHPQFDPVAFYLGPLAVRWYGIMYVLAFLAFVWLGRLRLRQRPEFGWTQQDLDRLLVRAVFGVMLGGRLGEVLLFQPKHYFANPLEIVQVWKGGMAFHGGLVGVLVAFWSMARATHRTFLGVADFCAPMAPLGLAFGRFGNFINGELHGRPCSPDLPWAMQFPQVDMLPRHPSPLYQCAGEGLLLFVLLWWFARRQRPEGAVSGFFLLGYGVLRFGAEFFRTPVPGIFSWITPELSSAQWLCVPMVGCGAWLLRRAYRHGAGGATCAAGS